MTSITGILISPTFLIYLTLLFLVSNAVVFILSTLRPKAFPPGPYGLPILGNLLQLDRIFPFLTFGAWAKVYGSDTPLGVKRGATDVVVLNSGRLVHELLEKRGAVYSDRPWVYINSAWIFKNDMRVTILQDNSTWLTRWRKEFNNTFGMASLTRFQPAYEAETARLLVNLLKSPTARKEKLEGLLERWIMSIPCLGVCGRRPEDMVDHGFTIRQFRSYAEEYTALTAFSARDMFPFLRYLPEAFGMAPWKPRARALRKGILQTTTQFLNVAKEQRAALDAGKPIAWESMLARMLREQRDNNSDTFTTTDMGQSAFHIVTAAINTSIAIFATMLLILAKDPELQQRVRSEILEVSGGATPKVADLSSLKYTEAFWNEVYLFFQ